MFYKHKILWRGEVGQLQVLSAASCRAQPLTDTLAPVIWTSYTHACLVVGLCPLRRWPPTYDSYYGCRFWLACLGNSSHYRPSITCYSLLTWDFILVSRRCGPTDCGSYFILHTGTYLELCPIPLSPLSRLSPLPLSPSSPLLFPYLPLYVSSPLISLSSPLLLHLSPSLRLLSYALVSFSSSPLLYIAHLLNHLWEPCL